jgi:ABC-type Fe3+/spermidine/putrescine transport system ATPase subunit
MLLELREISKSFDGKPALRGVSFGAEAGEIVVVLGPSGCGKTTLLRTIAGLETADGGRVCSHTPARFRHGLPGLRLVPPQECGPEC